MAPQGQTILNFYKERKNEPRVTRAKAHSNKDKESSERIKSEANVDKPSQTVNENINAVFASPSKKSLLTRSRSHSGLCLN